MNRIAFMVADLSVYWNSVILALAAVTNSSAAPRIGAVLALVMGLLAIPLAVSGKKTFIAPSASMTIHPVRVNGLVLGVPQAFAHFQRMQERIVDFVCAHSRMPAQRFRELCMATDELATDVGSVLDGAKAVSEGLIDRLGSLHDALEALYALIEDDNGP